jgi:hypothetical protein
MTFTDRTGITTTGAYGAIILSGVVFDFLSPWWLIASILLWASAVGIESGRNKKT